MKKILMTLSLVFIVSAAVVNSAEAKRTLVQVDGSSTVYPVTEAVAEEFQINQKGKVMVTVGVSGTGGGFKKFCREETDISDASRPIKSTEKKLCADKGVEYIELPVAFDGLAVMVNPKNTWVKELTVEDLRKIWEPSAQKKIMKWSDVRPEWPNVDLRLYGPGTDSGTFDYFTKAINGKEGASRGDYTASEDDNILVQGIANDKGAVGYFGLAYYEHNKDRLKLIPIDDGIDKNGKGPIFPSLKTVNNGTYKPLARPIYIYVSKNAAEKKEVEDFVNFYLENAEDLTEEVGYIPLPTDIYTKALKKFKKRKTGTVYGKDKKVTLEDIVK